MLFAEAELTTAAVWIVGMLFAAIAVSNQALDFFRKLKPKSGDDALVTHGELKNHLDALQSSIDKCLQRAEFEAFKSELSTKLDALKDHQHTRFHDVTNALQPLVVDMKLVRDYMAKEQGRREAFKELRHGADA